MIHLTVDELELVHKILKFWLPGREVKIFGSRASGTRLKPHSDIDLCVMGETPITLKEYRQLRDAFAISDLPMRVDIVNWSETSGIFRANIMGHWQDIMPPQSAPSSI